MFRSHISYTSNVGKLKFVCKSGVGSPLIFLFMNFTSVTASVDTSDKVT
jgi:hypothetical protein